MEEEESFNPSSNYESSQYESNRDAGREIEDIVKMPNATLSPLKQNRQSLLINEEQKDQIN